MWMGMIQNRGKHQLREERGGTHVRGHGGSDTQQRSWPYLENGWFIHSDKRAGE